MDNIKVTIGITTYNLEKYIAECLDSILCQKTSFPFKILVVDDASTDNTPEILKDYQQKYPDKIDLILKEKNGGYLESSNMLFNNIKTEYFSFIDGDDYWLTDTRLQEAIDFLDENQDYTMYGANSRFLRDGKEAELVTPEQYCNNSYTFENYLNETCPFVHTSAIVLRNIVYNNGIPKEYIDNEKTVFNCVFRGEDIRFIEHLRKGKLYVSPKIYSVYRIHSGGIWQGASSIKRTIETCLSNIKYPDIFPETKDLNFKRLKVFYAELINLLNEGYNLKNAEGQLLAGFFEELNKRPLLRWKKEEKVIKIKRLKYKIIYFLYKKFEKILKRKGII